VMTSNGSKSVRMLPRDPHGIIVQSVLTNQWKGA
jgi:hypothetical protein